MQCGNDSCDQHNRVSYVSAAELGRRIAALRSERRVAQKRLAEELGIDPSALSRVESGERGLAVGELVALSAFLDVSTDALLRSETDSAPHFRHDGDDAAAATAVAEFNAVIDDYLALEATLGR